MMELNGLFTHNVKSILLSEFKLSVLRVLWLNFFKVDLILALHKMCVKQEDFIHVQEKSLKEWNKTKCMETSSNLATGKHRCAG